MPETSFGFSITCNISCGKTGFGLKEEFFFLKISFLGCQADSSHMKSLETYSTSCRNTLASGLIKQKRENLCPWTWAETLYKSCLPLNQLFLIGCSSHTEGLNSFRLSVTVRGNFTKKQPPISLSLIDWLFEAMDTGMFESSLSIWLTGVVTLAVFNMSTWQWNRRYKTVK